MELLSATLDGVPDLTSCRGGALSADKGVHAGVELRERALDVGALGEAGSEEGSVDSEQDPGSSLEDDGGEENADPEEDLEGGDDRHGRIVVLLDESTNLIGERIGSLGSGRGTRNGLGSRLRSSKSGNEVGAGVGRDVEDRVDGVGNQSERVLRREEPDEGHDCVFKSDESSDIALRDPYKGTGRSHRREDQRSRLEPSPRSWHERAASCRQRCHMSRQPR